MLKNKIIENIDSGLSGRQIAKQIRVAQSTIWRIQHGITPNPGYLTAEKINNLYKQRFCVSNISEETGKDG